VSCLRLCLALPFWRLPLRLTRKKQLHRVVPDRSSEWPSVTGAQRRPRASFFLFCLWAPRSRASTRLPVVFVRCTRSPAVSRQARSLNTELRGEKSQTAPGCSLRAPSRACCQRVPSLYAFWTGASGREGLPLNGAIRGRRQPAAHWWALRLLRPSETAVHGGPCLGRGRDASQRRAVTDNAILPVDFRSSDQE